ncbi:NUDIX domain-containing protein, partial [Neobacillus niacini]|uniref:NUDIX domain-containing protein n=1 Tax=Neobacillus niacini TaxID=86668 RepID=UPI0030037E98
MDYCEEIREMIGNAPLIVVRPSVAILNNKGEILLSRYSGADWGIPGGILQLRESVEECIKRNVKEDLGLMINSLQLFGVYSGMELNTMPKDGEDEYHTVAIG